jgi:hypothetical protein
MLLQMKEYPAEALGAFTGAAFSPNLKVFR